MSLCDYNIPYEIMRNARFEVTIFCKGVFIGSGLAQLGPIAEIDIYLNTHSPVFKQWRKQYEHLTLDDDWEKITEELHPQIQICTTQNLYFDLEEISFYPFSETISIFLNDKNNAILAATFLLS